MSRSRRACVVGAEILVLSALLLVLAPPCRCEPDAVRLSVGGWVDGYFLSPEGDLGLHSLDLSSDAHPPAEPALHPLWAGYRVRLNFTPNERVTSIRVTGADSGEVLAEKSFDRPRNWPGLLLLCAEDEGFCHVRHGLSYRVEVTYGDGCTGTAVAAVNEARLLPIPELKIDWLDLVRIAEVRRWLREAGDDLLPGLRADSVPFALAGDDGQIVLVGWPAPPEGFHRYEGPAPVEGAIYVGELADNELIEINDAAGYAEEVRGTLAVRMPPNPDWGLTFAPRGEEAAQQRAEVMLHEVCHVNWRLRRPSGGGDVAIPPLETRLLEEIARLLLSEPNACVDGYPRVHQYLALMEERDRLLGGLPNVRDQWRNNEASEAYAYYVTWRARGALDAAARDTPLVGLHSPWPDMPPVRRERAVMEALHDRHPDRDSALVWWVVAHAEYHGFREIAMLHQMAPAAVGRAWSRGMDVRDALAAASGYADLSPGLKRRVLDAVKQGTRYRERLAAYEEESARGTEAILARFAHPAGPGPTPVLARAHHPGRPDAPQLLHPPVQFLTMFSLAITDHFALEVEGPSLVSFMLADGGWNLEVRTLLEEVSVLRDHPDGAPLELAGEEVRMYAGSAYVTDEDGVLVVDLGSSGRE